MMPMPKLFNFNRPAQAIANKQKVVTPRLAAVDLGNGEAELIMYGDVVENEPVDWWTGEPTGELVVSTQAFLRELDNIRNADHITVRLNSGGGDLFAGIAIHNALKQLDAKVTINIEGIAASAASVIACAGDEVLVHPGSLFMVHRGYLFLLGWYTPDDMNKAVAEMDAATQSMLNIYTSKTGTSEEEMRQIVAAETWFVGQEIVDAGFADLISGEETDDVDEGEVDEVIYDEDEQTLTVAGLRHDVSMYRPEHLRAVASIRPHASRQPRAAVAINMSTPLMAANKEGATQMNTVEELKASHPELVAEVERQAVEAERARQREIDEISAGIPSDLVAQARYEKPCSAAELALAAVRASRNAGSAFMASLEEDTKESNTEDVDSEPAVTDEEEAEEKEAEACISAAAEIVNATLNRKVR